MQRIPVTESHGRVHTSTMTVAILPQPSEVQIEEINRSIKNHNVHVQSSHYRLKLILIQTILKWTPSEPVGKIIMTLLLISVGLISCCVL